MKRSRARSIPLTSRPWSWCGVFKALLEMLRDDVAAAARRNRVLDLSQEHANSVYLAMGSVSAGWAVREGR